MIEITGPAARELKHTIAQSGEADPYVRVGVQGGGCSGFQWTLNLEADGVTDQDHVLEVAGLKVVIDKRSALYVTGTKLDFVETLANRGFKFSNAAVKQTCGCGSSFSY